jgi:rSAM/selenodomain-associated transferase 1
VSQPFILLDPGRPSLDFRGRCALTVMAKAPVPGQVKTRLTPPLTPEQAAGLNACFLRDTVLNLADAAAATGARWVISFMPAGEEAAFENIVPRGGLLLPQRGNGFGERLLRTAEDLFACGFSSVCLIDSDSPTVPTSAFIRAAKELAELGDRVVLGPSEDGGYYLLGLNRPHKHLFEDIAWSTAAVAQQTRERAKQLGLPVVSLPTWYDVDEALSLERLRRELFSRGFDARSQSAAYPASFTRGYLRQIGWSLNIAVNDAIPDNLEKSEAANFPN